MSLFWGIDKRTVNEVQQDGLFAYSTAGDGQRYEIWPVEEPVNIAETWALSLGDGDDSVELGRFEDVDQAQLAAELHDVEHSGDSAL